MKESICKRCSARILWGETPKGSLIPLDAVPHPLGTHYLDALGRVGPVDPGDRPVTTKRYRSHFATCTKGEDGRAA